MAEHKDREARMRYVESSVRSPQIVAAARRVMMRDSVARTTIRAVATEAGIPLGTLQHVFPTKELLLKAVIDDVASESNAHTGSLVRHAGLAETIREGARSYWHGLIDDNVPYQVMQVELLNYALRSTGDDFSERWPFSAQAAAVVSLLEATASNAGEVTGAPFERIARLFIAGLDGLMLQYAADLDSRRAEEDLEALIDATILYARIRPSH
ncbi:TetR/AcrR family transcriptional regulator [Microbacterium sp. MYb72]|uniref:TetR/AcrR family transcriptional regulator n=1 Tax=Microbacterium sp. MYb72 TaxID=1848693 RepID=UPI0011B0486F|nr:TetR/AcrR family transcriptional regulator [Microbacterium sp. MYb72]